MRVLLDTNILTRMSLATSADHTVTAQAVQTLTRQGHTLCLVPQVISEFWAVASRPSSARGGLGWTTSIVRATADAYLASFDFYDDSPDIFPEWLNLATRCGVSGTQTHDARLAAACLIHGFDALLTHNGKDFGRYGLNVLSPTDL